MVHCVEGSDQGGFAGSRPPGDHGQAVGQNTLNHGLLGGRQMDGQPPDDGGGNLLKGDVGFRQGEGQHGVQTRGEPLLGLVKGHAVHHAIRRTVARFHMDNTIPGHFIHHPGQHIRFQAEKVAALGQQLPFRQENMPFGHRLIQQMADAGPDATGIVRRHPLVAGNPIGHHKPDAGQGFHRTIGIGLEQCHGFLPQGLEDSAAIGRFQAIVLQKLHQLPGGMMRLPAFLDLGRRLRTDPPDIRQSVGGLLDNRQQFGPEMTHQAIHQFGPHAANHARGEIAPDSLDGIRQQNLIVVHLQLDPIAGMPFPVPGDLQGLAPSGNQKESQNRHPLALGIGQQAGDGEMVVGIVIGNALDMPPKGNRGVIGRSAFVPIRRGHGANPDRASNQSTAAARSSATLSGCSPRAVRAGKASCRPERTRIVRPQPARIPHSISRALSPIMVAVANSSRWVCRA